MIRWLFLLHRYLGMSIGIVMSLWCLSGFVMMYVPYPDITRSQQLAGLEPIEFGNCCDLEALDGLGLVDVHRFRVEMMAGEPVIRLVASGGNNPNLNLLTGYSFSNLDMDIAQKVAHSFQRQTGLDENFTFELVEQDQWTVTQFYHRHRPLYKFSNEQGQGSEWYVSSTTGEVVQYTEAKQRFWNWLGAIPHWLYPTVLRQHTQLWAQLVIWLAVFGTFLTLIGIYIGVRQWRRRLRVGRSPYRGVGLWHHYTGLVFGLLVLTWVFSGLMSMNPWNVIDFNGGVEERRRLEGVPLHIGEVKAGIERLQTMLLPEDTVRIEGYALLGKLYFLFFDAAGNSQRYDGTTLLPSAVSEEEWPALTANAAGNREVKSAGLIHEEDAYYYSHKTTRELPVYRIVLNDAQATRLYLSPNTGTLLSYVDGDARIYRWLFSALHQGDFLPLIRSRPLWDILMWVALLGVSAATVTGTYMGMRRFKA